MEWYEELDKAEPIKSSGVKGSAFKVLFELSPEHLAAVNYLLQNVVRRDGVNEDTHWDHVHTGVDLVKMGERAFNTHK